jgi:hypothetical protein
MRLLAVVPLVLFLSVGVCAQSTTGTLVGTVTDSSGLPMSGVSIVAIDLGTNNSRPTTTNDSGVYSISNLSPGNYRIEFQRDRFKTSQAVVELRVSETRRVDVSMAVGVITETVAVEGVFPLLQKDTSALAYVIGEREIQQYPVSGRQLENFLKLLPGVVQAAPNSHLSSRGGVNAGGVDEHYLSFLIDGVDNVDPVIRNFSYRPPLEFVEAIRLEQNGYSAEFGRNAGAVVNVTTKSGTNTTHGTAWQYFRNDNLDARNYFASADVPKPPLIRNQFGGTLGGPVKSNKTFFFAGFEILRQKTGLVRLATVPTELMRRGILTESSVPFIDPDTGQPFPGNVIPDSRINPISREVLAAIPHPDNDKLSGNKTETANRIENAYDISGRIDHQWTVGTRLMGRFSRSVGHVLDPFRTETTNPSNLAAFGQTADRFRTNVVLAVTSVKGNNLVNEFRAGYNRFRQPQLPVNPGTPGQQALMGFEKAFLAFGIASLDIVGSGAEFKRAVNVYNYTDSITYVKGNHQLRFGADVRRYLFNAYNVSPTQISFTGQRTGILGNPLSGNAVADFLLGLPKTVVTFDGDPGGNTRKVEFASYIEDDWKMNSRFTLNYGLRWEYYGRITEKTNKQSLWFPDGIRTAREGLKPGLVDEDLNNFAPRLGFAWRPLDDRTVIRASSGIFYDNDMRHNTEFFSNPPFFLTQEYESPVSLSDPFNTSLPIGSTLRPNTLDQKFRDTYAEHWNVSVQREIATGVLVEVAYVGNHTVKARRLRNLQRAPGVPYPDYAAINLFEQAGSSNYNALQVRVERRFSRGFGFLSSYTWGHAIDDRPGQGGGPSQDYSNLRAERGNADFDVRHNWVVSGSFELPFGKGKSWGGWTLSGISTAQSGRPFTVTMLPPIFQIGTRPNLVGDWKPANQGPEQWFIPAAFGFVPPVPGAVGNLGRNTLTGPGLYNLDLSLSKTQRVRGLGEVQFRAEFFNVLNHPNFGLPNSVFFGPPLGRISSTSSPERQIQFGLKLGF